MAENKPQGPNSEEKALDLFAEMMIAKIEGIKSDWKKPWFTEGAMQWPRNLSGREYNGMNSLMLLMHCEKEGYKIPRFCTFDCVQRLNKASDTAEKKGQVLSRVLINKGEKSFPVMLTTFTCVDKDTKEKIKYDDYKRLSDEERKQYNVYPKMQVFRVFNVEQTNLREARPELWAKLEQENVGELRAKGEQFDFEPVDRMIADNLWLCPIKPQNQDNAYYSISRNEIVVPEKMQFKDGESFYGTLFHEMTHSTGAADVLGRIKSSAFGSAEYAREELVAELGAALVAQRYGMTKNLKDDSAAYLKSWLDSLRESPSFIKTTLMDVKRATSLITQRIDNIALNQELSLSENSSDTRARSHGSSRHVIVDVSESKEKSEPVETEAHTRSESFAHSRNNNHHATATVSESKEHSEPVKAEAQTRSESFAHSHSNNHHAIADVSESKEQSEPVEAEAQVARRAFHR